MMGGVSSRSPPSAGHRGADAEEEVTSTERAAAEGFFVRPELKVKELQARAEAYNTLNIVGALIVGGALAIIIECRGARADAENEVFVLVAEMLASMVLALDLFGIAILVLQQYELLRLSSFLLKPVGVSAATAEGGDDQSNSIYITDGVKLVLQISKIWKKGKWLRQRATKSIKVSMPLLLASAGFYTASDDELGPGDWTSLGILSTASLVTAVSMFKFHRLAQKANLERKRLEKEEWTKVKPKLELQKELKRRSRAARAPHAAAPGAPI